MVSLTYYYEKIAEERDRAAAADEVNEELRASIIKLSSDKVKLWTRQEKITEAARAIAGENIINIGTVY